MKEKEEQIEQLDEPIIEKRQIDFQSLLQDIERNYLDTEKEVFYGKLWALMREYFDEKIENGLSAKTFWELRKKIKKYPSLTRIYEQIYFPEYNLETDTPQQRIQIIHTLKDELV